MQTVFISFLAMVTLGCSVGLVLLPVLLSLVGPVDTVAPSTRKEPLASATDSTVSIKGGEVNNAEFNQVEEVQLKTSQTAGARFAQEVGVRSSQEPSTAEDVNHRSILTGVWTPFDSTRE